ncbi:MAG: peroxiredoxin [Blastocatellia bacterium]
MRKSIIAVLIFASSVLVANAAPAIPEIDRIRIAEAYRIGERLQDELWTGWSTAPFSILFITHDYEFLFRHPKPNNEFTSIGYDKLLKSEVFVPTRKFQKSFLATFPALGHPSLHAAPFVWASDPAHNFVSKRTRQDSHFHRTWMFEYFTALHVSNRFALLDLQDTSFDNTVYRNGNFRHNRGEEKMTQMNIGSDAPDFTLKDGDGSDWKLGDHIGKTVVLLFYPGDNTPVCTAQLCSVRDHWSEYQETGAEVVGISTDTVESHKGFAEKNQLPLRLLSDSDRKVSTAYDMKSWLPGRSARGVVVIDKDGKIAYHKTQALSLFRPADDDVLAAIKSAQ